MQNRTKQWPRVPSGSAIPSNDSSVGFSRLRGAKNLWELPSCPNHKHKNNTKEKTKIAVASYNIRSLQSEDRLEELMYELNKITWDVVGLSEVRRAGEECLKLTNGHVLYYRGSDQQAHMHGVGLLINKRIWNNVTSIESISDRVIYVYITRKITLKIVQTYASTSEAPDEARDMFYEDIELSNSKSTYTIITGDFNAKIGRKKEESESFMGNFGYGTRNFQGDILVNFLETNHLSHMSSFFQKRLDRKWTWLSPGGRYKNEIDYIFSTHRSIIKDVSVLNSFNTGSDRRLVRAKVTIDAKMTRYASITGKKIRIDPISLKINGDYYRRQLKDRLQTELNECTININDLAKNLQTTLYNTAKEITPKGKNNRHRLKNSTKELLEKRRQLIKNGRIIK